MVGANSSLLMQPWHLLFIIELALATRTAGNLKPYYNILYKKSMQQVPHDRRKLVAKMKRVRLDFNGSLNCMLHGRVLCTI